MAKRREREIAKKFFIDHFKSQKEIAEDLGLTEKTVGKWVAAGAWKAIRDARLHGKEQQVTNLKSLIAEYTEKALELMAQIKVLEAKGKEMEPWEREHLTDLKKESTRISQEVAMYNKTLTQHQAAKIPLATYLEVMQDVFQALQGFDKDAYLNTLDFQKAHLQTVANQLG